MLDGDLSTGYATSTYSDTITVTFKDFMPEIAGISMSWKAALTNNSSISVTVSGYLKGSNTLISNIGSATFTPLEGGSEHTIDITDGEYSSLIISCSTPKSWFSFHELDVVYP